MVPVMSAATARPNSPMRIRCFGHLIPSSAMAVSVESICAALGEGGMIAGRVWAGLWMIGIAGAFAAPGPAVAAHVLITADEAKLPPPKGAVAADRRGLTRGPKVEFVAGAEPVHSPMHLQLKFDAFGGAKIDPDSVKVTYLRTPNVDLTPRVKSFVA